MLAACWKMNNRWAPSVVPGFPPTGARGVGSLKPTPGTLLLMMTMFAANAGAANSRAAANHASAHGAREAARARGRMLAVLAHRRLRHGRRRLLLEGLLRIVHAPNDAVSVRVDLHDHGLLVASLQIHHVGAIRQTDLPETGVVGGDD